MRKCTVPGCGDRYRCSGLCSRHYNRMKRYGDPLGGGPPRQRIYRPQQPCSVEGCSKLRRVRIYCDMHWQRLQASGELGLAAPKRVHKYAPTDRCLREGCPRRPKARGWCQMHHSRLKRTGDPGPTGPVVSKGTVDDQGYRWLSVKGRKVKEHRHVMEQVLGRPLEPFENVHHRNGLRADNRPENLELWVTMQPTGQRVSDLLAFAVAHYPRQVAAMLRQHRAGRPISTHPTLW